MNNSKFLADRQTTYRDCVIVPLLYTAMQDGEQVQGYGFVTVYLGNSLTAHCSRVDQWLISSEAALDVAKAQIDLDYLKLKYCGAERLR